MNLDIHLIVNYGVVELLNNKKIPIYLIVSKKRKKII